MFKRITAFTWAFVLGWILVGAAKAQMAGQSPVEIRDVYSNSDGSVQFIVLTIAADDVALAGQTLAANDGVGGFHYYTFPSEVPDRARGRYILIGTQGFADLNLVRPDFIVPSGFLYLPRGTMRLGGANFGTYTNLGCSAFAGCAYAAAINNAGEWTVVVPRGVPGYGGLFWNSPAGSEPGWAVAIERQGAVVVAIWATYDVDGSPAWFVMPRGEMALDRFGYPMPLTYVGSIYRMQGSPLGPAPVGALGVAAIEVGSAGLRLGLGDDCAWDCYGAFEERAEFSYSIQSAPAVTRTLVRQDFAQSVPICTLGGDAGATANYQGLWWNPAQPGWGLYVAHQGDVVFAVWLTYDAAGNGTWFTLTANRTETNTYVGILRRTTGPAFNATIYDPAAVAVTEVGTGSLSFGSRDVGTFSYVVNGIAATTDITRQIFAQPLGVCRNPEPEP